MMKHIAEQLDNGRPNEPLCGVFAHPDFDSLVTDVLDAQCLVCRAAWYKEPFAGEHKLDEDEDEPDWHECIDCGLSHASDGEVD